ncbi:unnamed protein product [Nesidiocoris tenuis]|uniref:Uncharacterized protein n=1 Tax=Nesidiocoris tenuis TaxID=355587 RepID=A0A6H5H1P8_9HEMI|nr:unnamed protein product [Nesidiocoris tenuis]
MIIRQAVREICSLPADTPIPVYYSPRKYRGLGLLRVTWEASIQHISISQKLSLVNDSHLAAVRDTEEEERICREKLGDVSNPNARTIRAELREAEFQKWTSLPQRGIGVQWYKSYPQVNSWVSKKEGLSTSEWTNGIKASMNSMANRATGGRSEGSRRCRYPSCNETNTIETLPHIRGACPKTEALRNSAHHKIRKCIADLFRAKGLEVYEEVHCDVTIDNQTRHRRADIVAINRERNEGLIVDPTIRWETNDMDQDKAVDTEKKSIYEPCIPNLTTKYGVNSDRLKTDNGWNEKKPLISSGNVTSAPQIEDFIHLLLCSVYRGYRISTSASKMGNTVLTRSSAAMIPAQVNAHKLSYGRSGSKNVFASKVLRTQKGKNEATRRFLRMAITRDRGGFRRSTFHECRV